MTRCAAFLLGALLLYAPLAIANDEPSLYDRIGGAVVMQRVAEDMLTRVASNPAVNQSFDGIDIHKLSIKIATHLCALTGGGCPPASDSISVIHAGQNINEREFYSVVESLRVALDKNGVGEREKNELLRILAPMKRDIVTR